jgi:hypothetical protein
MEITATKNNDNFTMVTFTWNEDLTECNHVALGVNDSDFDKLIENRVHEGCDLEGWTVKIK